MARHQLEAWFQTLGGPWVAACCCGWSSVGQGDDVDAAWQRHWAQHYRGG